MLVSNFELLYNRTIPLQAGAAARRCVQGHFLTISNTELHRPVYFSIRYIFTDNIPLISGSPDQDRETLAGINCGLMYDGTTENNAPVSSITVPGVTFAEGNYYHLRTQNIRLRPGETGMLTLLPLFNPATTNPQLEARGFIHIRQEPDALYRKERQGLVTETHPCIGEPAKVLLTSEHRGTFLDDDFNGTNAEIVLGAIRIGFDFDQLSYALPLAEGRSLYTLPGV